MTYDEIARALQCCQGYGRCDCEHCPADGLGDRCDNALLKLAADAIDHLLTDNAALRYAAASKKANRETVPYLRAWVDELCAQKDRMMAENAALREKVPQWISVEDSLPEVWKNEEDGALANYMIYSPEFGVDIGNYHAKAERWLCVGLPCTVTHWMPLPEAPEEGDT